MSATERMVHALAPTPEAKSRAEVLAASVEERLLAIGRDIVSTLAGDPTAPVTDVSAMAAVASFAVARIECYAREAWAAVPDEAAPPSLPEPAPPPASAEPG